MLLQLLAITTEEAHTVCGNHSVDEVVAYLKYSFFQIENENISFQPLAWSVRNKCT